MPTPKESNQERYEREVRQAEAALADCPTVLPNETIPRYWRNKQTGMVVTALKYEIVDSLRRRIVYTSPVWAYSLTQGYEEFVKEFEPATVQASGK